MHTSRGSIALAFSGGLDTSYCVPRLGEQGWAVHTVYVNTGGAGPAEREAIRRQAEPGAPVEPVFTAEVRDAAGEVVAEVEKRLWVRKR